MSNQWLPGVYRTWPIRYNVVVCPQEKTMAAGRKLNKQRRGEPAPGRSKISQIADEELALADELLRVSRKEQAELIAGWEKFMKQLQLRGKPIGSKKLREILLKRGFDPESNQFSQGIIAIREE
jgi:hypothetical protein